MFWGINNHFLIVNACTLCRKTTPETAEVPNKKSLKYYMDV